MLVAEGLVKRYGRVRALQGFDLVIEPGEIAGLIGHNGAGKTTFLEIVTGLTRADAGRVLVGGVDVARSPRLARRSLGLAPQEPALYPAATVRQHLRLFGGLAGLRGRPLSLAIDGVASRLELTEVLDRPAGLLSGGQRRRTQAATAMVHRPELLLLDEPTAGADPETRQALLDAVRELAAAGTAVCYTTHYLPELEDLDATLAVAARGRLIARGDRRHLLTGLPSQLRVRFDGPVPAALAGRGDVAGDELRVVSMEPDRVLAELAGRGYPLASVDVLKPTLDDLYRSLAQEVRDAA
jgi:ABC-type multidrug transport system ATPase subunit